MNYGCGHKTIEGEPVCPRCGFVKHGPVVGRAPGNRAIYAIWASRKNSKRNVRRAKRDKRGRR